MRILFLSHYFPPERNAPAARTIGHCRRWVAAGHSVTVVTCVPHHPRGRVYRGYRNRVRQIEHIDGIRVIRCLTLLAANEGTWKRSASYVFYLVSAVACALVEHRPDVVIATSPQFFCGWAGVLISRIRRVPLLLEIRDLWPESIAAVGAMRPGRVLRVMERMEQYMYRSAGHIVTVGEGYRRDLIERGVEPRRVSVVMNGVDAELFSPQEPDRDLMDRLGLRNRFVITYCGAIGLAHGLEVVVHAGELLQERGREEVLFVLVGDGARLAAIRAEAMRRTVKNVIFTGAVERNMVPALLSVSDVCLVHLRKSQTFTMVMPSKIFEAAAMARPLILGVRGFAQDFVERAGCGLCIEPEDEHELVDAALRLADDAQLRERLGRAGRKYVSEAFDRDRLAAEYLRIIGRVMEGDRRNR